jgi:hypothetical protein
MVRDRPAAILIEQRVSIVASHCLNHSAPSDGTLHRPLAHCNGTGMVA